MKHRLMFLLLVLAAVATGCGDAGSGDVPAVSGDTPAATTDATSSAAESDMPVAPDFTLALGDGGEFTLSQEQKPVYMVFWAEW